MANTKQTATDRCQDAKALLDRIALLATDTAIYTREAFQISFDQLLDELSANAKELGTAMGELIRSLPEDTVAQDGESFSKETQNHE